MNRRARGVVVDGNKILTIRRLKNGREYYVVPGGGVEKGETPEQAAVRELKEETNLDVNIDKYLFSTTDATREEMFFLVTSFDGTLELGGTEKERMTENNQYHLEWKSADQVKELATFYTPEVREKILTALEV